MLENVEFCAIDYKEIIEKLETSLDTGLTEKQYLNRLARDGYNELPDEEKTSVFKLFMEQFEDTLVKILLFAAVISAVIGLTEKHNNIFDTLIEPMVILLVLVVNAIISVKQTLNAEEAIQALKEYEPQVAKVIRSPHRGVKPIKARELVCGDIVEISVGDRVPADLRVCAVYSSVLCADQSILTGESLNVIKHNDIINIKQPVNQDKTNILFSGTNIVAGRARACVIATGTRTEIGKIREHLLNTESARTPLQIKLDEFGNQLSFIITIICVLVWVVNIHHFDDAFHGGSWVRGAVYYFKIAISLAVAAIPEGLPAVITTCLAIGTRRMAKKAAIVRTLRSVETLGCTSVICSDKTGTITTNQMAVQRIFLLGGGEAGGCGCECGEAGDDPCGGGGCSKGGLDLRGEASGQSRGVTSRVDSHGDAQGDCRTNPSGGHCDCGEAGGHLRGALTQFSLSGTTYDYRDGELLNLNFINNNKYNLINKFLTYCCVLCNDATLTVENNSIHRLGEATEAALLVLAEKLNVLKLDRRNIDLDTNIKLVYNEVYNRFKKLFTLEFSRDRKSMSVYCEDLNNRDKSYLFAKGAPEEIISRCKYVYNNDVKVVFSEEEKSKFLNSLNNACVGQDTFRCIGLAVNDAPPALDEIKSTKAEDFKNIESDMIFLGVVGMIDPPRAQVLDAINKCGEAGIRVIVITGDNKDTAEAICHRVGIFKASDDLKNISFSSKEFDNFSHKEKLEACARAKLFSRVEPKHKSEIVGCLQELGEVTAMTGDGVNDAPALKKAEIGVAMGSGTAVAKSAADIVLADDNFSTIVSAVFEGRAIFNNAVQFISYLVSSNIGEVVCILITSLLGLPECLIPVQLLWVNLITDGLPATALGFNPPPDNIMKYPPRDPKAPMIGRWQMFRYFSIGVYIGLATIAGSLWWYLFDPTGPLLTFKHLIYHQHCSPTDPMFSGIDCQIFNNYIPMTISLSILVFTEMFNACNSMSDTESILVFPPWRNGYLILAITSSILIHLGTLYFSITQNLFDVIMLNALQWKVVLILSFPVIFLDEILKFFYRMMLSKKCKDKLA